LDISEQPSKRRHTQFTITEKKLLHKNEHPKARMILTVISREIKIEIVQLVSVLLFLFLSHHYSTPRIMKHVQTVPVYYRYISNTCKNQRGVTLGGKCNQIDITEYTI